ncbi:MBL fold metallo-hydrolase [Halococcus sediminicola]|uniref:hypothetical protein n=1 Tax=Halococcus sediminicola TaxID=1264579 RepID=UPI000ACD7E20|nr:hypothetical protein [Halococcus sediminicola]
MLENPEKYGPYGAGYIDKFAADEIEMSEDQKAINQITDLGYDPADPIQQNLYIEGDFGVFHSPEYSVTAISGNYDVFGDGTIECIPTPGHSPGHQAVKVELEDTGTVILAADLAFIQEAYEKELQPAFAWDTEHAIRSNRKIRNLERKENAEVYLAHDRKHFEELPNPPESLV